MTFPRAVANAVIERSRGMCEAMIPEAGCNGRGEHIHHRKLRSQGGKDTVVNCVHICHKCHDYIHRNSGRAYANGWLVRAFMEPENTPFNYRGTDYVLNKKGGLNVAKGDGLGNE